jgi:hypothetical protein
MNIGHQGSPEIVTDSLGVRLKSFAKASVPLRSIPEFNYQELPIATIFLPGTRASKLKRRRYLLHPGIQLNGGQHHCQADHQHDGCDLFFTLGTGSNSSLLHINGLEAAFQFGAASLSELLQRAG